MKKSFLRLEIVAIPLLLSGCVAVWGGSYQIESQTPEAIIVQYDTNFIDESDVQKLASEHCQTVHKTALLQAHDTNMWNISTEKFLCQKPSSSPVAAPK